MVDWWCCGSCGTTTNDYFSTCNRCHAPRRVVAPSADGYVERSGVGGSAAVGGRTQGRRGAIASARRGEGGRCRADAGTGGGADGRRLLVEESDDDAAPAPVAAAPAPAPAAAPTAGGSSSDESESESARAAGAARDAGHRP